MSGNFKKYQGGEVHQGGDNKAPYPVSRLAPGIDLVDLAREIAYADNMLTNQAEGKLKVIAEQIRTLQDAAREVLAQTQIDQVLHRARCSFKRVPGKVYHLYEDGKGEKLFSMLSPDEWGGRSPYKFIGSFRLENDMSWTEVSGDDSDEGPDQLLQNYLEQLKRSVKG